MDDIININENYCQKFDLKLTDKDRSLPIMYCLHKHHKIRTGVRFIIASKMFVLNHCHVYFQNFKILFKGIEEFYNKTTFYSSYKKFWVVENSFPIIEKLNIIKTRQWAKKVSTYDFRTLYTTIPHKLLIKVLSEIIHFVFKLKVRSKIGFSTASVYWTFKGLGKR